MSSACCWGSRGVTSSRDSNPLVQGAEQLEQLRREDALSAGSATISAGRMHTLSSALVWLRSLRPTLKGGGAEQLQDGDQSSPMKRLSLPLGGPHTRSCSVTKNLDDPLHGWCIQRRPVAGWS